jgi:Ca2+-binding EF-hand superfamily protein
LTFPKPYCPTYRCVQNKKLHAAGAITQTQALKVYFNCLDVDDSGFIERDELVLWVKVLEKYCHSFPPVFTSCGKFTSTQSADVV